MIRINRWTLLLTATAWATVYSTASAGPVTFKEGAASCAINLTAEPAIGQWNTSAALQAGQSATSTGGYRLTLDRDARQGHAVWSIKLERGNGESFQVTALSYDARTDLSRVVSVFDTQSIGRDTLFRQAPQLDTAIESRPNRGVPYMMACDHYGNNAMAVGAIDQTGTYRITGRRLHDEYSIMIARQEYPGDKWFTGTSFEDALFVSTHPQFWYDTACAFADDVDRRAGYTPNPIHPKADLPYYSTWYSLGDQIDQDAVMAQARLASRVGCGNFLIFIGWSECENWFSSENAWGDYTPCASRFADFAGMIRTIQEDLDMAVQLWVAPTWIGASSKSFEKMADYRSKWPGGGYDRNLDPRSPEARAHIRERFAFMAEQHGIDGVYVDFLDTLYNRNDAEHPKEPMHFGSALQQYLAGFYDGLTSVRPEAIVEYRMPFANLLSKRSATVFTTTYTEGDWNNGRLIAMAHRFVGKGVINRTDPLVWTKEEYKHHDTVGRSFSAMLLLGPPGISMDLTVMNDEELDRMARWLAFYRAHRENLVQGEFRPFGEEYHNPEMMVHRGHTAYAWVSRWQTGHIPFPEGTTHAFIFTALPEDVSFIARIHPGHITGLVPGRYRARWFNSSMESHDGWFEFTFDPSMRRDTTDPTQPLRTPRENWDFHPGQEGVPSLDVRRGGFLELEKIE